MVRKRNTKRKRKGTRDMRTKTKRQPCSCFALSWGTGVQLVTWHASEIVLHCCNISLLVLLQRQEGSSSVNTHRFVIAHFVQLLLCHGHWRNYTQQADVEASTQSHNHTEMGPVLCFSLNNNWDMRRAGMAWGKKGFSYAFSVEIIFCSSYPAVFICAAHEWRQIYPCVCAAQWDFEPSVFHVIWFHSSLYTGGFPSHSRWL